MNPFISKVLKRSSSWLNLQPSKPPGANVAEIVVDLDNVSAFMQDNAYFLQTSGGPQLPIALDDIIDWITYDTTGIDVISKVFVFRTKVADFDPYRWVYLRDPSRFELMEYRVDLKVPGYGDDEMYRLIASRLVDGPGFDTVVFLSNDNGMAVAGQKLGAGFKPYRRLEPPELERLAGRYELLRPWDSSKALIKRAPDDLRLPIAPEKYPEVLLISSLMSEVGPKNTFFVARNNVIDLNQVLTDIGCVAYRPYPHRTPHSK